MATEIAQEGVVVRREVAYAVVLFSARVDDGSGVVREAGEVDAVFLAHERFYVLAFFGVVEEQGVVGAGGQAEFARVVKVERCDGGFGFGEFELLETGRFSVVKGGVCITGKEDEDSTLVGRKVPITSEVFWVSCGPPGGGGGTTRGPAIVGAFAGRRISTKATHTRYR